METLGFGFAKVKGEVLQDTKGIETQEAVRDRDVEFHEGLPQRPPGLHLELPWTRVRV